ncbi:MAG: 6,7-dimethyl-8-ribityllumazine synthase [Chitinophagaceae bacterium]|nr:6,7-dimethyl-8-ribityllumazine synthase [Bacteroidota bacterium]MCC6257674.1 6,7-dimethyl-8-ribityllumazine synthase [Chitinophagaceae bacterium]MCW5916659.1 6,7-dimethyl-8-ribityllumazine synthase [Ferruginibacter sp.]
MAFTPKEFLNTTGIRIKKGACVVIVRTEWNTQVTQALLDGCIRVLTEEKISFKVIDVPGAFEIPFAIKNDWDSSRNKKPSAYIALGCIIKGDTPHFDFVAKAVTDGVLQLNLKLPVPTIFGILTVHTQAQADERTGGIHGHKGCEAAITAIKMMAISQFNKRRK